MNEKRKSPFEQRWVAVMAGFAVGTIFWLIAKPRPIVNLVALFYVILALAVFYLAVMMLYKWWMGERWASQHWFVTGMWFLSNFTIYGIALSAIAYDLVYYVFVMRG